MIRVSPDHDCTKLEEYLGTGQTGRVLAPGLDVEGGHGGPVAQGAGGGPHELNCTVAVGLLYQAALASEVGVGGGM